MILDHLGDAHHSSGDLLAARHAWKQAMTVFDHEGDPTADIVRAKLDRLDMRR